MEIPIRHSFIILLMEACLLIKGEECWTPMVCDDQPTWKKFTNGQCTKEEDKALEALTARLDGMKSELNQLKKVMEESETNSVKETTTPQVTVLTCPSPKAPDNGTVDSTTAPDLEFGQIIEYSCNAGYVLQGSNIGKCEDNGTWGEVPTCLVDLTCDFESLTNPTCGYTRISGTFERDKDITGYVLAGNGTIRSLPKALADNEELCMSVNIKGTSDGELVAKAHNGTVTRAIWPFSASITWKTEKFILMKVNSTDTEVQLELEASGNVELDNITTLNSSECYGLATPCAKRNLENGTISPEQDLYSQDQEVSYSCNNDSTLEGGQTGTCKADGSWSTTPVCTPIQCVKQTLEKGTISPEQELYSQDQEVSYSCSSGYILEGGQTGTCKADGSWSTTPVCTPIHCVKRNLDKGTISPEQELYNRDQEVSYSCNNGYTLEGEQTGRCKTDGSWSTTSVCTPIQCVKRNLERGTISPEQELYSQDEEVSYTCHNGYSLDGDQTGRCKADGSWSTTPACTPIQCVKQNLEKGTISPEQELYSKEQEVSYSCSSGYTLEGGQTGTCKSDGSWSTTPVCKCDVVYNSKCFRAIIYGRNSVSLIVAETLCGNKLANIYDVTHYNRVRDYLRSLLPDGWPWIGARTGMTYRNGQLYSTTGQAISLPNTWSPNDPYPDASYTTVVVSVRRDKEVKDQGIHNDAPSTLYHAAICETEL